MRSMILGLLYALVSAAPALSQGLNDPPDEVRLRGFLSRSDCLYQTRSPDHPTFEGCRRLMRDANARIEAQLKGRGNVSANMSVCIYYCEALYPGSASEYSTNSCYILGNPAVIRGKLVRLQKPTPSRDYALDLSEPICIANPKSRIGEIKQVVVFLDRRDKVIRNLLGIIVTVYFSDLQSSVADPLAVVGIYSTVYRR
jgi:hypothetical protein